MPFPTVSIEPAPAFVSRPAVVLVSSSTLGLCLSLLAVACSEDYSGTAEDGLEQPDGEPTAPDIGSPFVSVSPGSTVALDPSIAPTSGVAPTTSDTVTPAGGNGVGGNGAGGNGTDGAAPMGAAGGGAAGMAPSEPAVAGAGGGGGVGGFVEPELGADGYPLECAQVVSRPADATQEWNVNLALQTAGQPFVFGEVNALQGGGTVLPTNFRFYISQPALLLGQDRVPVTFVDDSGAPLPYGVQLVNAEDADSLAFRFAGPPGSYDGLVFLVGLWDGCNALFGPGAPPLDEASQLKWPHTLGFLFLRFEGQLSADADPLVPNEIHMGAAAGEHGGAPHVEITAPIDTSTTSITLTLAFDQVLTGAMTETDLSDFSLLPPAPPTVEEEVYAGERLRRAWPSLDVLGVLE